MKIIKDTNLIQIAIVLILALSVVTIAPDMLNQAVLAEAAETCPDGGDWVKIDGLKGDTFTYTAPEGKLVAETCYKAGTNVVRTIIDPPQKTVTITSAFQEDLSHASVRLVDEPTPMPTNTPTEEEKEEPTPTFTPMPTEAEPTPTPTEEEKQEAPTFTPMPTDEEKQDAPTPTLTDEEKQEAPTSTPTEEENQEAPTPQPTAVDPPAGGVGPSQLPPALFPILISIAGIGLISGLIIIGKKKTIYNK